MTITQPSLLYLGPCFNLMVNFVFKFSIDITAGSKRDKGTERIIENLK